MERKVFKLALKSVSDTGEFEGYLSVFNNIDAGNDRVRPGAFTKTLAETKVFPLLYVHNSSRIPVGDFTAEEDSRGLKIKGTLYLSDAQGGALQEPRQLHVAMTRRSVTGLSMGYETVKSAMDGQVRDLLEVRLFEGSVVPWPMNDEARILDVKTWLDRFRADMGGVTPDEIGAEVKPEIIKTIESLKTLCGKQEPGTPTPPPSTPPAEPPTDSGQEAKLSEAVQGWNDTLRALILLRG